MDSHKALASLVARRAALRATFIAEFRWSHGDVRTAGPREKLFSRLTWAIAGLKRRGARMPVYVLRNASGRYWPKRGRPVVRVTAARQFSSREAAYGKLLEIKGDRAPWQVEAVYA